MTEAAIGGEKRQRHRIVDRGLHAIGAQMRGQRVAARMPDGVEVIDVGSVRRDLRHHDVLDLVEAGIVDLRPRLLARCVQRGRCGSFADRIAACRPSSRLLMPSIWCWCLDQPAVAREHRHSLGERGVAGDDGAGVAHRAEVLARDRTR